MLVGAAARRLRVVGRLALPGGTVGFQDLSDAAAIRLAYETVLAREPEASGLEHYLGRIRHESLSRQGLLDVMRWSEEAYFDVRPADLLNSLHLSRCDFVRSFPRARRILDLGGTHQSNRQGAFVGLGYPYPFDRLVLVDLPPDQRHELYRHSEQVEVVTTRLGPVEYAYHSMTDLTRYPDCSFDLVYSGQSIEHITEPDADLMLAEVWRVLCPGGWLALDTPNATVCRLQTSNFINDDHKIEYTHEQLSTKVAGAGFTIRDSKGLNYLGHPAAEGGFDPATVAGNRGVYGEPGDCYLLAYLAQKP